jgi:hypothetical protein
MPVRFPDTPMPGDTIEARGVIWSWITGRGWVPDRVTNFQARALMRRTVLPDGRSLETAVRESLAAAKAAADELSEAHPARIAADEAWLAWEQSNEFMRYGALVTAIGAQMGFDAAALDQMFRDAALIEA